MIGVDIIELGKIEQYAKRPEFLNKVYTKKELDYANKKINHLATAFAAKEAIFKALGTGMLEPRDIEILRNKNGKPEAKISSDLKKLIKNKKIELSLSVSDNYAVAFAMLV